jgi:octanoyl-[GcvH]:protein N-octanoyltransferase
VPDDVVVFSLLDARRPGFAAAREAAARHGCAAVLRLGGGHAALFHRRCLAFGWAAPDRAERDGIRRRFETVADWLAAALRRLGVDARIGEVPGEYCPGEYSVNARGRVKLMGVGQRVIRGAAHVGGVIVVHDADRVREVLEPVYTALDLDWAPRTAGAVEDECTDLDLDTVRRAVLEELADRRDCRPGHIDDETLRRAGELLDWHDPVRSPRSSDPRHRATGKLIVAGD